MTKEQLTALGISDDLAAKAATASAEELKDYIPKHRFDEISSENKNLKATVAQNESDLEALKKSSGDSKTLQEQIEKLQNDAKEKEEQYQKELTDIKFTNAIKLSLSGKAQDEDLVAGLFDRSKLILSDDGKITGLDEQLKTLTESKSFLFKQEEESKTGGSGFVKIGGDPPAQSGGDSKVSLKDALTAHYQKG